MIPSFCLERGLFLARFLRVPLVSCAGNNKASEPHRSGAQLLGGHSRVEIQPHVLSAATCIWNRKGEIGLFPRWRRSGDHLALADARGRFVGAYDSPLQTTGTNDRAAILSVELIGAGREHDELGNAVIIDAPIEEIDQQ